MSAKLWSSFLLLTALSTLGCSSSNEPVRESKDSRQPASARIASEPTLHKHWAVILCGEADDFPVLQTPRFDAYELAYILNADFGYHEDNILMLDGNVPLQAVRKAIGTELSDIQEDDSLLVFYAGHGIKSQNSLFLPFTDSSARQIRETCLSATELVEMIGSVPCGARLLMLDACYSGSIFDEVSATRAAERCKESFYCIASGGDEPVVDGISSAHSPFAMQMLDLFRYRAFSEKPGRVFSAERLGSLLSKNTGRRPSQQPRCGFLSRNENIFEFQPSSLTQLDVTIAGGDQEISFKAEYEAFTAPVPLPVTLTLERGWEYEFCVQTKGGKNKSTGKVQLPFLSLSSSGPIDCQSVILDLQKVDPAGREDTSEVAVYYHPEKGIAESRSTAGEQDILVDAALNGHIVAYAEWRRSDATPEYAELSKLAIEELARRPVSLWTTARRTELARRRCTKELSEIESELETVQSARKNRATDRSGATRFSSPNSLIWRLVGLGSFIENCSHLPEAARAKFQIERQAMLRNAVMHWQNNGEKFRKMTAVLDAKVPALDFVGAFTVAEALFTISDLHDVKFTVGNALNDEGIRDLHDIFAESFSSDDLTVSVNLTGILARTSSDLDYSPVEISRGSVVVEIDTRSAIASRNRPVVAAFDVKKITMGDPEIGFQLAMRARDYVRSFSQQPFDSRLLGEAIEYNAPFDALLTFHETEAQIAVARMLTNDAWMKSVNERTESNSHPSDERALGIIKE